MTSIAFAHSWPDIFNIGDYLCSPRHWFAFGSADTRLLGFDDISDCDALVLGGGAFTKDLGMEVVQGCNAKRKVLWGVGVSQDPRKKLDRHPLEIEITRFYNLASTRDRQLTGEKLSFVPCPSVMSSLVDIKPGNDLGIFFNANPKRSPQGFIDQLKNDAQWKVFDNSISELGFRQEFSKIGRVVTNSYHMAFWSLLSGREVMLFGYSSKFISLLDLFCIPISQYINYDKNNPLSLKLMFERTDWSRNWVSLGDPQAFKEEFRHLNLNFAARVAEVFDVREFSTIPDDYFSQRRREEEINARYAKTLRVRIADQHPKPRSGVLRRFLRTFISSR
jgi:hypothetical protein